MRLMIDFISGIISALFPRSDKSCTRRQTGARQTGAGEGSSGNILGQIIARFLILVLSVGIGAAALLTATAPSSAPTTHEKAPPPTMIPPAPTTNNFDDILATDPSAPPRVWRYIVLHHSASVRGSAQSFDQYHREVRHWQSLGYHFVIGNGIDQGDGIIVAGPRWYAQEAGAHANSAEYNEHGIGICLVGNFEDMPPTPAQLAAVKELVRRLAQKYQIGGANITGHNLIRRGGSTACPGKFFPLNEVRAAAAAE